jgi:class 3 adenylate cyclase
MSELLKTFAAYVPPAITRAILQASAPVVPAHAQVERFPAAVLFADVSGFTPLTEALAQKGAEGPEELTRLLNKYFSRMIALIEGEGGRGGQIQRRCGDCHLPGPLRSVEPGHPAGYAGG